MQRGVDLDIAVACVPISIQGRLTEYGFSCRYKKLLCCVVVNFEQLLDSIQRINDSNNRLTARQYPGIKLCCYDFRTCCRNTWDCSGFKKLQVSQRIPEIQVN